MSMAAQNVAVGHDTEVMSEVSMLDAATQLVPECVTTRPAVSTAAQKLAVGHDTDVRLLVPSMVTAPDQLEAAAMPEPSAMVASATPAPAASRYETRWCRFTAPPFLEQPCCVTGVDVIVNDDEHYGLP